MDIVNEILKLKSEGLKINEIAIKLNIPVGTIKSKLFRSKNKIVELETAIKEKTNTNEIGKCKSCGTDIIIIKGKKARKFCCDYCRVKYWRKHKDDTSRV